MVDQGAIMFSMALVPLYSTLGIEGMQHILHQSESIPNMLLTQIDYTNSTEDASYISDS